jgi:hypothetical protein
MSSIKTLAITSDRASGLISDVMKFAGRFVSYPTDHAHVAHVLWLMHAHLMDCWESTPRLAALSAEPGSGKTRLLETTAPLVPRPIMSVNVTPAYLFRKMGDPAGRPTILYDEIDTVFGPKAKPNEDVRGLLNAGHRRNATAGRCVTIGKLVTTEEIPAYAAVALAGLNDLPATLMSRSIVIRMRPRAPNEFVEPWRERIHVAEGEAIRSRIEAWAALTAKQVEGRWPDMPASVTDRAADCWEPLLAVADAIGGEWPVRARDAAVSMVAAQKQAQPSLGVRLLHDLCTVFGDAEQLPTETILDRLLGLPEAPWAALKSGPLNERILASRLRAYDQEIKPEQLWFDGRQLRGYRRTAFVDVWRRYPVKQVKVAA